jgi:hypothetical protein
MWEFKINGWRKAEEIPLFFLSVIEQMFDRPRI